MVDLGERRDVAVDPAATPTTPVLGVPAPGTTLRYDALSEAPFGVAARGLEWGAATDADIGALGVALRRHLLVVLRGQRSPSEDELDAFLRRMGRLVLDTDDGRAHYAGHLNLGGRPASEMAVQSLEYMSRAQDNRGSTMYRPGDSGISELVWHNDQSHRPMLKVLSVLEMTEMQDEVVPTEYRDMYTACECLDPDERGRLERRQVVYFDPRMPGPDELPRLADAMHPAVLAHPHSGRRTIYVNDFAARLVGLNHDESEAALAGIRRHVAKTAPKYVHRWERGDLVLWDNIGLQHRRDQIPAHQHRVVRQHGGLAE